jgi:hypothetical protein
MVAGLVLLESPRSVSVIAEGPGQIWWQPTPSSQAGSALGFRPHRAGRSAGAGSVQEPVQDQQRFLPQGQQLPQALAGVDKLLQPALLGGP